MTVRTVLALLSLALFSFQAVAAADGDSSAFHPNIRPSLHIARTNGAIRIDGNLDDPGWVGAARATNFTQYTPVDMVAPPDTINVLVTYDDDNLYVAFIAFCDPGAVRASLVDRDEAYRDDYAGMMFDTFGGLSWYYEIFVNPLGCQMDLRATNAFGEDETFDMVWYSEGHITSTGFQVECAIPFASLRFPNRTEQEWRTEFWWNSPRDTRRRYAWAAVDRDESCFSCQFGTLTGIANVHPGSPIEFLPSFVGYQGAELDGDPRKGLQNEDADGEASLGMKYAFSSNLTAEATYNPDFSQIESDAGQIDVNTTYALFYDERRPFFQEGSDLFESWLDGFYTRSINDPIFAAKSIGRFDKTSVAYTVARDDHSPVMIPLEESTELIGGGKSTSNIARVRSAFGEDSFVGGLVTDRRLDGGGAGTVFSGDMSLRIARKYRLELQALASHTDEPTDEVLNEDLPDETFDNGKHTVKLDGESFWGNAVYASFERDARTWNFDYDFYQYSPTVRADNGFLTRNGYREFDSYNSVIFRPNTKLVEAFKTSLTVGRLWEWNGRWKDEWLRPGFWIGFKGQNEITVTRLFSQEVFKGIEFDDIRVWDLSFYSAFSEWVTLSIDVSPSRIIARNLSVPQMGEGIGASTWLSIKPLQRLIVQPQWQYSQLDYADTDTEIFRVYILRTYMSYQFTRRLFVRLIVEYFDLREIDEDMPGTYTNTSSLSIEPLVTYKINPFTTFYVGSNHYSEDLDARAGGRLRPTSRQFFMKLQYLIRM